MVRVRGRGRSRMRLRGGGAEGRRGGGAEGQRGRPLELLGSWSSISTTSYCHSLVSAGSAVRMRSTGGGTLLPRFLILHVLLKKLHSRARHAILLQRHAISNQTLIISSALLCTQRREEARTGLLEISWIVSDKRLCASLYIYGTLRPHDSARASHASSDSPFSRGTCSRSLSRRRPPQPSPP